MSYRLAADLLVLLHSLFVLFVLCGGLLNLHSIRWSWLHVPALLWGVWVEWAGWLCPLTPLEVHFRKLAGQKGYSGGFIEQYLLPIIYPGQLTRELQWLFGAVVILVNLAVYCQVIRRYRIMKSGS